MKHAITLAIATGLAGLAVATPASAYTCSQHYQACLRYNHGPVICGCAKNVCSKKVGAGDAGDKWDSIPGIMACWKK
jgi:hypothetical protein